MIALVQIVFFVAALPQKKALARLVKIVFDKLLMDRLSPFGLIFYFEAHVIKYPELAFNHFGV